MSRAEPSLAGSLVLVTRDPYRVLMMKRGTVGAFWHALVFPGGRVERGDHESVTGGGRDAQLDAARAAAVRELWEEAGIVLHLSHRDLLHVGHWLTPSFRPRRFDTHFFLSVIPAPLPIVIDGVEAVDAGWCDPKEILRGVKPGDGSLMFPTAAHLSWLAQFTDADQAERAARNRRVVTVRAEISTDDRGVEYRSIPAEAGYPIDHWSAR